MIPLEPCSKPLPHPEHEWVKEGEGPCWCYGEKIEDEEEL